MDFSFVLRFLRLLRVDEKRCSVAEVWRRKILARLRINIQPHRGEIHMVVSAPSRILLDSLVLCLVLLLHAICLLKCLFDGGAGGILLDFVLNHRGQFQWLMRPCE